MKIMEIVPSFKPGGGENLTIQLSLEISRQKMAEVCLVSFYSEITPLLLKNLGATVSGLKIFYLNKRRKFDPTIFFKLWKVIADEKPDCVHTHLRALCYVMWVCFFFKIRRKIHTIHSVPEREGGRLLRLLHFVAFRVLGWIPVALSSELRMAANKLYGCQARYVHNGILPKPVLECRQALKSHYSQKIGFRINDKLILNVANLSSNKNQTFLIKTFSKIRSVYSVVLLIVGSDRECGKDEKRLKAQVAELPKTIAERIFFLGERNDVPELMQISDVFVLPSLYEGMPMSILEAMAYRIPVIATKVGAIPELLEGGCGLLVSPEDKAALANAIEEILESPNLALQLKKYAARRFSNEFHISKTAEAYYKLFTQK
jgi:glycosyltransferase involved in cell wall biosynthesis